MGTVLQLANRAGVRPQDMLCSHPGRRGGPKTPMFNRLAPRARIFPE
jgi:hypothetical protein